MSYFSPQVSASLLTLSQTCKAASSRIFKLSIIAFWFCTFTFKDWIAVCKQRMISSSGRLSEQNSVGEVLGKDVGDTLGAFVGTETDGFAVGKLVTS